MNSGSFFRLDLETSKVMNGVTYFEYVDLPDYTALKDSLTYPIRLTITSDRVSIFVHYFIDSEEIDSEEVVPHHSEEVILDLPYLASNSDALSSTIKRIYNTVFPLSDYLLKLLNKRYIEDAQEYSVIKNSQSNKDSFSSLYIWGLIKDIEAEKSQYQLTDKKRVEITGFLRKLLLDFMFDLMHSDVFEASKYYSQMEEGLMSNCFFSSIAKKCEYYYYRRLVRNRIRDIIDDTQYLLDYSTLMKKRNKIEECLSKKKENIEKRKQRLGAIKYEEKVQRLKKKYDEKKRNIEEIIQCHETTNNVIDSIKKLYAERLDDAESAWIDTIVNPIAEEQFTFFPEWYEEQETRKKRKGFCVSESWFVNPEEEMARIFFPLPEEEEGAGKNEYKNKKGKPIHYLNSFELGSLIGTNDNSSILDRNSKVSKWFYRRFDFVDTFRLHFFKNWNHIFAGLLLAFCIVAILPCFWIWDSPINLSYFLLAASAGFFSTALFFWVGIMKMHTPTRIDEVFLRNRRKREINKSLRFGIISLLSWAFLSLYNFFDTELWMVIVKVVVWIGLSVLLLCLRPRSQIIENIHILLPRLVASITTAWVMLVIGNELVKEYLSWPICVIIVVIVFVFILYESNKSLPNISTGPRIWRAMELMLVSYSIAILVGIFAIDVLSPSFLRDAEPYLEKVDSVDWTFLKDNRDLIISFYPQYLIRFSFLAMFIGVFIQMIFEEKNITEM